MAKISQYIIKEIPSTLLRTAKGEGWIYAEPDEKHKALKRELSNYLNDEYSNGYMLCGIDFDCGIAVFRSFLNGV